MTTREYGSDEMVSIIIEKRTQGLNLQQITDHLISKGWKTNRVGKPLNHGNIHAILYKQPNFETDFRVKTKKVTAGTTKVKAVVAQKPLTAEEKILWNTDLSNDEKIRFLQVLNV